MISHSWCRNSASNFQGSLFFRGSLAVFWKPESPQLRVFAFGPAAHQYWSLYHDRLVWPGGKTTSNFCRRPQFNLHFPSNALPLVIYRFFRIRTYQIRHDFSAGGAIDSLQRGLRRYWHGNQTAQRHCHYLRLFPSMQFPTLNKSKFLYFPNASSTWRKTTSYPTFCRIWTTSPRPTVRPSFLCHFHWWLCYQATPTDSIGETEERRPAYYSRLPFLLGMKVRWLLRHAQKT